MLRHHLWVATGVARMHSMPRISSTAPSAAPRPFRQCRTAGVRALLSGGDCVLPGLSTLPVRYQAVRRLGSKAQEERLAAVSHRRQELEKQLGLDTPSAFANPRQIAATTLHKIREVVATAPSAISVVVKATTDRVVAWVSKCIQDPSFFVSQTKKAWKTTKEVSQHYWTGMKLLVADVRVASRIFKQLTEGRSLTRRERAALLRTTADMFRLVPFAIFVIVPFMELLLPITLKLFPNMLPSTFDEPFKAEESRKRQLKARLELARFLQECTEELALTANTHASDESAAAMASEVSDFIARVREGERVSNEDLFKYAKLFNDSITLDTMGRPQLVALCRYMGLSTYGGSAMLRFKLQNRLRQLKADDRMIYWEGINSLSTEELKQACAARGMRAVDLPKPALRKQLQDWLELSLNQSVPSSLLILSRAFTLTGPYAPQSEAPPGSVSAVAATAALKETLGALPEETLTAALAQVSSDNDVLLKSLKQLEQLISEEHKAEEAAAHAAPEKKPEAKESAALHREAALLGSVAEAVTTMAASSPVQTERELLQGIKNKVESEPLAASSNSAAILVKRLTQMLKRLDEDIVKAETVIGGVLNRIDKDKDGVVSRDEIHEVFRVMRDRPNSDEVRSLMQRLDRDNDGLVLLQEIERLLEETRAAIADETVDEEAAHAANRALNGHLATGTGQQPPLQSQQPADPSASA